MEKMQINSMIFTGTEPCLTACNIPGVVGTLAAMWITLFKKI